MLTNPKLTQFSRPDYLLAESDAATVGAIIATASDIALVIDPEDRLEDFAIGAEGLDGSEFADWVGRPIEDLVNVESRQKVRDLVREARKGQPPRWREINHPMRNGRDDLPVRYCAVPADTRGRVMLLGRDLRPVAALQRRLVTAQQSIERDYARLLQTDTQYRMLFQSATEAFLIVDSVSLRIQEANRASLDLLGIGADELPRRKFPVGIDAAGVKALEVVLGSVRSTGRAETAQIRTADGNTRIDAYISLFRADSAKLFLIRLTVQAPEWVKAADGEAQIVELFRRASEAIVLTDETGRIDWANDAFLDLVQVAMETQVQGEAIDRFFARQGIDLPLILDNTRDAGRLRYYSTSLAGVHGTTTDVEVSTVLLPDSVHPGYGFVFRNTAFRPQETQIGGGLLPRSAEQLTELIGRVPMKDLVRETVDVIERLCIEAALQMTDDNRASAADLLGLSRQSLYVKLRRYGLGEVKSETEST
jgi:transcriptional regulator PpsR